MSVTSTMNTKELFFLLVFGLSQELLDLSSCLMLPSLRVCPSVGIAKKIDNSVKIMLETGSPRQEEQ